MPRFENSRYDNDKGVREGSKEDMERDRREKARMKGLRKVTKAIKKRK